MDIANLVITESVVTPAKLTKDEKRKLKVIKRLINNEFKKASFKRR